MDLDKSLDEIVAEKRKTAPSSQNQGKQSRAPRVSSGNERRSNNSPYSRPPPRSTDEKWVHDAYQGPKSGNGNDRRGGDRTNTASLTGTGAGFTGISTRIEVVGLHYEVTPADLKGIFSQAGTLVQGPTIRKINAYAPPSSIPLFDIPIDHQITPKQYDRSGRSKGEATMEFASPQQAKIAINKFDGAMTKGQTISIRLLPPIVAKPRPGPGGPGSAGHANAGGQSLLSRIQGGGVVANPPAGGRGGRGGRGGPQRGRGGPGGRGGKRGGGGPKSEGDLDKELDSFMNNSTNGGGDVEMA